jgi:maltose alpha-D-glucosyltransferase/alpha-amylase
VAFTPVPASVADRDSWRAALLARAASVSGLLESRVEALPDETSELARSLLRVLPVLAERIRLPEPRGQRGFTLIRVHGDYHLGQTLKTATGFVVIDFEGEPARPLAERRARHCAVKDVAGMLRSLDYAFETARVSAGEVVGGRAATPPLREAFLEGYLSHTLERHVGFLPRDRASLALWLDFFELDKVLYEVDYEVNHRPGWLHIPLSGALRILERDPRP